MSNNSELRDYIESHPELKREKAIFKYLSENFAGQSFTLSDGITAVMDKGDAKELSHKASDMKVAELSKLREIIEKAVFNGQEVTAEHKKFSSFRYYSIDAMYQSETIHIQLNVGKEKFSGKYHIYEINRGRANRQNGLSGSVDNRIVSASSNDSISQESDSVNREFSDNGAKTSRELDIEQKARKWAITATDSKTLGGKVPLDSLDSDIVHYEPISNKTVLAGANGHLERMGYDKAVAYFRGCLEKQSVTLQDLVMGERLIQEAVKQLAEQTAKDM